MKHYLVALFLFGLSVSGFAKAQCAAFPCVVATVTLTNQSHSILNTPIFTPTASGIFRISAYLSTSAGNNQSALWLLFVGWTDDNGARKVGTGAPPSGSNAAIATFVAQAYWAPTRTGARPWPTKSRSSSAASEREASTAGLRARSALSAGTISIVR